MGADDQAESILERNPFVSNCEDQAGSRLAQRDRRSHEPTRNHALAGRGASRRD